MSVGTLLRQLRESRGVSLEEIARATRVNSSYLHALEADDFASLPVAVFTRGFIRAYCQALGEPPDAALALFDGRLEPAPATASGTPATDTPRPATPRAVTPPRASGEPAPKNRGPVLVSFILLVVLGVALFAVTLALQSGRETPGERRAAVTTPPARGPETPAGTAPQPAAPATAPAPATGPAPGTGTPPGAAAPAARQSGYRLVARTVEPTWMRVRMDDGRTTEETIPAGQVREWFSTGPFTLTVGNAGGVNLEVNGRALPSLGPSGTVIPRLVVPTELQ